jgi:transcriptional regulator with XRE-family HTH domain
MAEPAAALDADATLGDLLRYWRRVRSMSQLDLASAAMTTPRHMSFVETGRSRPSREMVLRLAGALDVPLRDRNGLLLAAGYAPLYVERGLDHPALDRVNAAVSGMLAKHEPLPAVVMDRGWNLLRVNGGARRLFTGLFAPEAVPASANVLRVILEPGPVRSRITNWHELAPALLERARREAVGGVLDLATAELVQELRSRPDVESVLTAPRAIAPPSPVVDVHVEYGDTDLRFFSVVSTIGTPVDVTAQELRVEAFFPADDETAERWRTLDGT